MRFARLAEKSERRCIDMMDCLLIFAAGKSSRFDGFPKAFCSLGQIKNVENTINLARQHFKKIYLIVNRETYTSGIADGLNAIVISIVTGQGDADSILKTIKLIKNEIKTNTMTACWGDAVFLNDEPFIEMEEKLSIWEVNSPVMVGCSFDPDPYAWFDIDGSKIAFSHFKKREQNPCSRGLHDQSIFMFNTQMLISYLERYKRHLGLDKFSEDSYDAARGEMSLLDAFTWFYKQPGMQAAEFCLLTGGRVMSFNTPDELCSVIDRLREYRSRRK